MSDHDEIHDAELITAAFPEIMEHYTNIGEAVAEYHEILEASHLPDVVRGPSPVTATGALLRAEAEPDPLIAAVDRALVALDDRLPDLVGNPAPQVFIHQQLSGLVTRIKVLLDEVEKLMLDELPMRELRSGRLVHERLVVEGLGIIDPIDRGGRWVEVNWPALLRAVVRAAWESGDVEKPEDVAAALAECISFNGMKSDSRKNPPTGLAKYGLDRSQFARYIEGVPGVRIID